jgi:hypothetical protein
MVGGLPDETARAIKWLKSYSPCNVIPDGQTKGNGKLWQTAEGRRHAGTSAKKALQRAFDLKPGAIFYVSDGEPTDATPGHILDSIESWQKNLVKRATINAFAYKADGGLEFMSKLARQNGGEFKNIK